MNRFTLLSATVLFAACGSTYAASGTAKVAPTSAASKVSGDIKLSDTDRGLAVSGQISGLTPGDHGFHVHEFGVCDDEGKAAGSHFNPGGHPHGNVLKDGSMKAHAGDMGNLKAGADGVAKVDVVIPGLTLAGTPPSVAGRALIVHEKADDFGQPTGNAGGRSGCGVVVITNNN